MKNILVVIIFVLFSNLNAENNFGIKAGLNLSSFQKKHTDVIPGYSMGIFADFTFLKNLGFSFEICYSERGGILRDIAVEPYGGYHPPEKVYSYDFYSRIGFIELPVLIKMNFNLNKEITINPYIGFSLSQPINDKTEKENKKQITDEQPDFDVLGGHKVPPNGGFALDFGCSLHFQKFIFDLRYYRGLQNLNGIDSVGPINYKIHTVQILLGYEF